MLLVCYRSKNDLAKQLTELKGELLALRVQKIAGGSASKLTKMCVVLCFLSYHLSNTAFPLATCSNTVRKSIARVLTVTNQKQRQNLREFYKNKKYLPLDLRAKKTRAIRRRLTAVSCIGVLRLGAVLFNIFSTTFSTRKLVKLSGNTRKKSISPSASTQ